MIDEQQIVAALHGVPIERWPQVLRLITAMQLDVELPATIEPPIRTTGELLASGLAGTWSERTDLGSSQEFARQLRHDAEWRRGA